ncbi:Conserved oligomeric Golgi complex subunit 4 [Chionoecetes opilio]|uniref:Conserved oligomeric Golgi complex subunit 4 n=1 Tax=Chionoecetes opilio TaxID=41210 RepID=A0A8J4YNM7_CHIOP|nr:Conserved oligomeric Golgi complex subunit 4 [Chionoecetes opilio]
MGDEEQHVDPKRLTSLSDIKIAYDKLCQEEVAVAERLEWSVGNRHHLEARLSQLARLVPTLQLVQADARQLENTISFTHQLANNVSAKVRQLDLAKSRVVETQARVGDLLDLEGCSGGVATALAQEDQCPPRDTLIVLGDFNATTGTVRDGYELCVGPHGSGTRNTNSSLLLNFARSRRLRIAGSWYQRPELHRWTWYSNAGGVAKEIDHILVSTRWRILQNCRVYRSAEFFGTDHRLVVATLKLHVKSRRISRGNHTVFHLEKLKDLTCAHEYAVAVSNRFDVLGALRDPVELWDTFKREIYRLPRSVLGSAEVKAWFCLDGDAGENRGESRCQAGWEPGPAQGSVTPD